MAVENPYPLRGEIWFVKVPSDPPEKGPRPVIVVSTNERNRHPRADSVLVAPLTTSVHKSLPTHVLLSPGETGLAEPSAVMAENLLTVRKESLSRPRFRLRTLSNSRICEIARKVMVAMDCALQ